MGNLHQVEAMRVDIEVASELSSGQTVCDKWRTSRRPVNCQVATEVDVRELWKLMIDAVLRCDAVSPMNTLS